MTSEIDLERALIQKSAKLGCGSLSMSLALATGKSSLDHLSGFTPHRGPSADARGHRSAASLCILIPPVASLASFTKPPLGPEWALIRANAPHAIVQPGAVTIGMFQTCIITPAVRCSALAWPPKFGACCCISRCSDKVIVCLGADLLSYWQTVPLESGRVSSRTAGSCKLGPPLAQLPSLRPSWRLL